MLDLTRLELCWLARPSRQALIRAARDTIRREGLPAPEDGGGGPSDVDALAARHVDRLLAEHLQQDAQALAAAATTAFRRRYGRLVSDVVVELRTTAEDTADPPAILDRGRSGAGLRPSETGARGGTTSRKAS